MPAHSRYLPAFFMGLLFLLTSVPLSSVASVSASPIILVGHGSDSSNWSGYAVTGSAKSITSAQGSWVVPTVTCRSAETSYSAFWVGIDGFNSKTVEQTGTDSDCSHGTPHYYAWYEFYPKASKNIGSIAVHSGDVIGALVQLKSGSTFIIVIRDFTTGKTYSTSSTVSSAQRSSAEFIVEAPETCTIAKCKLASLSDFGTAGFGVDNTGITTPNCAVGVNGVVAALGTYGSAVQQITMVSQSNSNVVKSQPSALSTDGTSFTVQWMNAGP